MRARQVREKKLSSNPFTILNFSGDGGRQTCSYHDTGIAMNGDLFWLLCEPALELEMSGNLYFLSHKINVLSLE